MLRCSVVVLDARIDARVDEMVQAGLVEEMLDFHRQYNEQQLHDGLCVLQILFVSYFLLVKNSGIVRLVAWRRPRPVSVSKLSWQMNCCIVNNAFSYHVLPRIFLSWQAKILCLHLTKIFQLLGDKVSRHADLRLPEPQWNPLPWILWISRHAPGQERNFSNNVLSPWR